MNVALVGFDREGRASYDYFARRGDTITICDQKTDVVTPEGVTTQLGEGYLDGLDRFDVIVRTPGLSAERILEKNPSVADKITSGTNIFFEACPTKNIIGITGTKGKGTTSTIVAEMLRAAGKTVHLGGNIGVPALGFIDEIAPGDWVVLELSSFQLSDIRHSPHIAVCLMVVPEHQDWHIDFVDYTNSKQNLFRFQDKNDTAIYFPNNTTSKEIASVSLATKIPYYAEPGAYIHEQNVCIDTHILCKVDEIRLLGEHNWQNVCAAITVVWQITQDVNAIRSIVTSFSGLPHRLEYVGEKNGILYYDDSFGTTPETAMVALKSFLAPKVLIAGGSDKGASYQELAQVVATENVRAVITIGETGPAIKAALTNAGYMQVFEGGTTMTEIVHTARSYANAGDIVLLSTASASFGLFKSYTDRGNQFKQAVLALS